MEMGDEKSGNGKNNGISEPLMSEINETPKHNFRGSKLEINTQLSETESQLHASNKDLHLNLVTAEDGVSDAGHSDTASNKDEESVDGRGNWGGKMEFLFTCIGYAVGLGNVWRFPYLAYKNGGGAFLIPYVIMLAFVGLPLFFMELAFGQYASLGPITIWKINPLMKGLGYAMVASSWLIGIYYNVIISHVLLYLVESIKSIFTGGLPWVDCDNWWNTELCIAPSYATEGQSVNATTNVTLAQNKTDAIVNAIDKMAERVLNHTRTEGKTAAEEFYNNYVLEMSDGIEHAGGINWKLALCLLLAWVIVLVCLIKGIQSLGKVVYFTALFPYLMLTILLIRGASLPGARQGVEFYLKPDFSKLTDARVWCDAATQIFYSLSACSGGLIAMSSYNKFNNNCYKDSLIVALINCGTSVYAGFVIFCVLGFMAKEKGVPVAEVAAGGPGLAFVVYPEAISRMPVPQMWAIFFFIMMATLGFGSQFSIVEAVLSAFTDEFYAILRDRKKSMIFRTCIILVTFLLGLPMVTKGGIYLLNLVDYSVSGFPLLFIGFFESVCLNWVYGYDRFSKDIGQMLGRRPNIYWKLCWKAITPLIITITVMFNCIHMKEPELDGYMYPEWAQSLGWCIQLFPILLIPFYFLYRFCMDGGFKLMSELSKPLPEWGPASLANKQQRWALDNTVPLTPKPIPDNGGFFKFDFLKAIPLTSITRAVSVENNAPPGAQDSNHLSSGGAHLSKSESSLEKPKVGNARIYFDSETKHKDQSHV